MLAIINCKIIERFRNLPLSETINACKEWENTPPEQRVARLQRLHRDAQIFKDLFYPGGDVVVPDCNQGQPPTEQAVNPTNESTESESTESSEEDDSDSEEDDSDSEEDDSSEVVGADL
ncbi:hypothetical protein H0G86_009546 [Trichoderma simmonsii]|uniref:Uncharacterized protein n=1 Tax=Trichoderma simmonsii TaxID=1491479 RepID=A0A8G0LMR5_9HYPO|nr:hypothetical protein H0G86_009546 [Trichoderma simmonsii]